jgi:hypothetical protein
MTALTEFLQRDLSQASSPPHVAVCSSATDRWLYTGGCWVKWLPDAVAGLGWPHACTCCLWPSEDPLTSIHLFPPVCAFAAWALQRLEGSAPAELQPAAAGLRTLVLPANQLSSLADLAWSLSQHPRTRFAVVANGMEACGSVGDVAAMLSGGRAAVLFAALMACCPLLTFAHPHVPPLPLQHQLQNALTCV